MWTYLCVWLVLVSATVGQFELHFVTPPKPHPTLSAGGFDPNCSDKLKNCHMYGEAACKAPYEQWARDNCAVTCGVCRGPTTPSPPCEDKLEDCESYDRSSCTDPKFQSWAADNCRRTCRICSPDVLAALDALKTTVPPSHCVDKLDCRPYGKSACGDQYKSWAKENCMKYCGFCIGLPEPPKICHDKIPNCASYQEDMCTNVDYKIWAEDNCNKFCGLCPGHSSVAHTIATPPNPHGRKRNFRKRDTDDMGLIDWIIGGSSSATQEINVVTTEAHTTVTQKTQEAHTTVTQKTPEITTAKQPTSKTSVITGPPHVNIPKACVDNAAFNCDSDPDVCLDRDLAELFCPASCGLCTVIHTTSASTSTEKETTGTTAAKPSTEPTSKATAPSTTPKVTTEHHPLITTPVPSPDIPVLACFDQANGCQQYGPSMCRNFHDWAVRNCMLTCGFCVEPTDSDICEDAFPDCHELTDDTCTNPEYRIWAWKHCRRYCGFCTVASTDLPSSQLTTASHTVSPSISTSESSTPVDVSNSTEKPTTFDSKTSMSITGGISMHASSTDTVPSTTDNPSSHSETSTPHTFTNVTSTSGPTQSSMKTSAHESTTMYIPTTEHISTDEFVSTTSHDTDFPSTDSLVTSQHTTHHSVISTTEMLPDKTESTSVPDSNTAKSTEVLTTESTKSTPVLITKTTDTSQVFTNTTKTTQALTAKTTVTAPSSTHKPVSTQETPMVSDGTPTPDITSSSTLSSKQTSHTTQLQYTTMEPYTSSTTMEPDTSSTTMKPYTSSTTMEPDSSSTTMKPDTSSTTMKPYTSSTTMELDTSSTTMEPDSSSTTMEPYTSSTTMGPDTSSTTMEPYTSSTTMEPYTSSTTMELDTSSTTMEPDTSSTSRSTSTFAITTQKSAKCGKEEQAANCMRIDDEFCFGIYEPYAREYCGVRCGYCPGQEPSCVDKLPDCADYGLNSTCVTPHYSGWARENCIRSCNGFHPFCSVPKYRPPTDAELHSTLTAADLNITAIYLTRTEETCEDKKDLECYKYPDDDCCGPFKPWAVANCPKRCGMCNVPSKCLDKLTYCANFDDGACQNDQYKNYLRLNCRKFCNFCGDPPACKA